MSLVLLGETLCRNRLVWCKVLSVGVIRTSRMRRTFCLMVVRSVSTPVCSRCVLVKWLALLSSVLVLVKVRVARMQDSACISVQWADSASLRSLLKVRAQLRIVAWHLVMLCVGLFRQCYDCFSSARTLLWILGLRGRALSFGVDVHLSTLWTAGLPLRLSPLASTALSVRLRKCIIVLVCVVRRRVTRCRCLSRYYSRSS